MKVSYLFVVFLISITFAQGQNQMKADSLKSVISSGELTTNEQLEVLYWLSTYSSSPEDKLRYGNDLLAIAKEVKDIDFIIKAKCRIGVAHRFMGNLGEALEFLFSSANVVLSKEEFDPYLADIYAEISTSYTQNGDSKNALLYGSKSINILRKADQDQKLAISLLNTGYDYYLIENYDSAMAYYNESEPILEEIGMDLGLAYIIGNRALVYWKMGNSSKAKEDLVKAISILEPLGDVYGMADYYNQLGNVLMEENNLKEAVSNTLKGLEMARKEGMKEQIRDASNLLFLQYRALSDYKNALDYQIQYIAYRDSIQNPKTTERIAKLQAEFELGQKQAQLDVLLKQKKSNQLILNIAGIIIVVLSIIIIYFMFAGYSKNNK